MHEFFDSRSLNLLSSQNYFFKLTYSYKVNVIKKIKMCLDVAAVKNTKSFLENLGKKFERSIFYYDDPLIPRTNITLNDTSE